MNYSRDERLALAALLEESGPEAPTLCAGWQTGDLAAHLVLREQRADAGLGELGGLLKRRTNRMLAGYLKRYSFADLVARFRSGPPRLSVFALPGADEMANTAEYFVHTEDVRRAAPGWTERELAPGLSDVLWKRISIARLTLRRAPTGVVLARSDGPGRFMARKASPSVTITGTPAELTMWVMGRARAAHITLDGPDEAMAALIDWRG